MLQEFVDVAGVALRVIPFRSFLGVSLERGSRAMTWKFFDRPFIWGSKISAGMVQPGIRTMAGDCGEPASR